MIGCLTETTACVVAKPLVLMNLAKVFQINAILHWIQVKSFVIIIITSRFATAHVVVSVRHPITY